MSHVRRGSEVGVITPRSAAGSAAPPRGHGATIARLLGAAGMVALTVLLFWLLTDDSFRVSEADVTFTGLRHADETALRSHLQGLDREPNVFRVRASEIVAQLSQLPEVLGAEARVSLPAAVSVTLDERDPVFAWSDDEVAWLVDAEGTLFAPAPAPAAAAAPSDPPPRATAPPTGSTRAPDSRVDLPLVVDRRLPLEAPAVGSHLPATDLAVMRQLLAVTPEHVGSSAGRLWLQVDQDLGYVLYSDLGWYAVFGHYTPLVQPPDYIPAQVQCLHAAVAADERRLGSVRLALSDDACGTLTNRGA